MRYARAVTILVALLGSHVLGAQVASTKDLVNREGPLSNLAAMGFANGPETCSPYFRFSGVPKEAGKVGVLTFIFSFVDKATDTEIRSVQVFGSDKLEVHVVPGKTTPTAKMIRAGGPVYPWVILEISPDDFAKAPCLAHSKVVR